MPEGYARISFSDLQPDEERSPVSSKSLELDGQKVFIKGYVHPGVSGQGDIRRFVLVRDMGTCCFGGQPKLTDMVEVTLDSGLSTRYTRRKKKLAGVFLVDTELKPVSGLQGVYYQLKANYVR